MTDFLEYNDREELVSSVAKILAYDLIASIKDRENVMFSVPGGSTPGPIFDKLCEFDLDWRRVSIILNDERWVPESNERSNTKLLRERLLIKKATLATYISMYSDTITPELGIPKLKKRVDPNLPISVLLFGMGADMHTASLFPGGDKLEEALSNNAPTLLPMRAAGAMEARMTLTAQVLNSSRFKHLVIFGEEKRKAFEKAIDLPNSIAPVSAILPGASVHWAA
ncbi:MAG: 6-phosphogluconolactonase [Paracoccaceae bacterium]|nr:6-phosphogluconolactonase [Paracoccaceae bacterium]